MWKTLIVATLLLVPATAFADRDKAAALYKLGQGAFARGTFSDAAAAFEAAYAEDPRGASIYNAALAWQNAHDDPRAADDFSKAVASWDLVPDLLDNAKAQLAKLEATLGKVSVTGPAGVRYSVAHVTAQVPSTAHFVVGRYVVHVTYADGASGDFPVEVMAGVVTKVDVTPHAVVAVEKPLVEREQTPVRTRAAGLFGPATLPAALSFIAGGVVAGGFSVGLGVATLDALNDFNQSGHTSQSDHDRASTLRDWTNGTFVAAVVLGAVGITALITSHRVKMEAQVGLGSISLVGRFQ